MSEVAPAAERPSGRPWLPPGLAARGMDLQSVQRLVYIVVDELVGQDVGLSLLPWPVADAAGRVRFPDLAKRREISMSLDDLDNQLYKGFLKRAPRVGDVFASELNPRHWRSLEEGAEVLWTRPFTDLFPGKVYDVTVHAREVAKLAFYASVSPLLTEKEADDWHLEETLDVIDDPVPVRSEGVRGVNAATYES